MAKKWTGLFLILVMTTVIALEVPALKYCLCSDSFVGSDYSCSHSEFENTELLENTSCCSHHNEPDSDHCAVYEDTKDCILVLAFDLGDYYHGLAFDFSLAKAQPYIGDWDWELQNFNPLTHVIDVTPHYWISSCVNAVPLYAKNSAYLI